MEKIEMKQVLRMGAPEQPVIPSDCSIFSDPLANILLSGVFAPRGETSIPGVKNFETAVMADASNSGAVGYTAIPEAPEEINFAGERAEAVSLHSSKRVAGTPNLPTATTSPVIPQGLPPAAVMILACFPEDGFLVVDESLAVALDEGQNSSNAWRLHNHVNGCFSGQLIDGMVATVEVAERGELR